MITTARLNSNLEHRSSKNAASSQELDRVQSLSYVRECVVAVK